MDHSSDVAAGGLRGAFGRAQFGRWFGVYFLAACLVFVLGGVVGGVVVVVTDLTSLAPMLEAFGSPFPDRITFGTIASNNLLAVGVTALGLISFGTVAVAALLLNGVVLGIVLIRERFRGS